MEGLRRLSLENIVNCRDLGGYPGSFGATKFKRFLRCGIPLTPTQDDIVELLKYGVGTVIDLRGDWESEETPSVFRFLDSVDYHHVCLFEINAAIDAEFDGTLEKSYEISIDNYKENYAKVLNIIADAKEGCVLYHCFFGKDRTGMLTALLLHIAGVSPEDIIADYQVSYTYLVSFIQREKNKSGSAMWETDESNFLSEPNNMASLLNYINQKYGSVDGYLKEIGITEETKEKIRKRFLA